MKTQAGGKEKWIEYAFFGKTEEINQRPKKYMEIVEIRW